LPVKAVRPAVGRGDEVAPGLAAVRFGLAHGLDTGAVQAQEQGGRWGVFGQRPGGVDRVVLHAAVDVTDEGPLVGLVGAAHPEFESSRATVDRIALRSARLHQTDAEGAIAGSKDLPAREGEDGFAYAERR